ncbi:MAG: hypothetical protein H0W46_13130 [Acidimicrobiia bacterium]|nr:hypothetical protein [Acidimicrobiia bacterium]
MRGVDDVVAAGDVAAWAHPHAPEPHGLVCVEHWSTAREMARSAVANLLAAPDERRPFSVVPTFWSDQYDVKIKSAGLLAAATHFETVEEDAAARRLIVEARRDGELVGAVVFNKNRAIVGYTRELMAAMTSVGV